MLNTSEYNVWLIQLLLNSILVVRLIPLHRIYRFNRQHLLKMLSAIEKKSVDHIFSLESRICTIQANLCALVNFDEIVRKIVSELKFNENYFRVEWIGKLPVIWIQYRPFSIEFNQTRTKLEEPDEGQLIRDNSKWFSYLSDHRSSLCYNCQILEKLERL